nr:hypothetical protein [Tanacetum cinerariifolium]
MIKVLPPKTTEEVMARERERKARTTLLMALPEDHLAKFHKMADAKEMLEAIKSRFGGNDESKKMQQYLSQDNRRRDTGYNGNKTRDNGRRHAYQDDSKALVTIDGEDMDWSGHVEEDTQNYAMMSYSSSNSSFDNEVKSCSKACEESYARLKKLYDEQRDKLGDASVEITAYTLALKKDDPHRALKDKGIVDSGCSRYMTGNKDHFADYQEFKSGSVAFGGSNGRITGKGKIKTGRLDFEDVYYVEELKHYNLFSVSQMCDKKNKVLFTDTDCLVLSPDFKLPDENQKGKQHKASCKAKTMNSVNQPLQILHITSDETTPILKDFIRQAENQFNHKVKTIKSDNGTEFKKNDLIKFCRLKGIKREYSNARCLQQNGVAERKNRTLIEATRTMVFVTKPQNKTPYELLTVENQANKSARPNEANNSTYTQANDDQDNSSEEIDLHEEHFVLPIWSAYSTTVISSGDKIEQNTDVKTSKSFRKEATHDIQNASNSSTNLINTASTPLSIAGPSRAFNNGELSFLDDPLMPHLEDIYASPSEGIFTDSLYDDEGVVTDFNNVETTVSVSLTLTIRIHTIHPKTQILRDPMSPVQTRSKVNKNSEAHALNSWCDEFEELMKNGFQMSSMGELAFFLGLQFKKKEDGIFISKNKYVAKILKKFNFLSVKTASTPIETYKPLVKDEEAADMDVHLYRFMIGSLMYLTASGPDIMFVVCACSRFEVTPKSLHLQAVKRIFRYLKDQPKLGLWYPKVSSFDQEGYSDSDYAGVNLDRKSITGGCQFLSRRLILWKCKKQTIMATSTTKAEYVAAAHCCG